MALDRFIRSVRTEVAKRFDLKSDAEIDAFFIGMEESAKDNQEALEKRDKMLRDTVAELHEAKRLLETAVNDIQDMLYQVDSVTVCTHCIHTSAICYGGSDCEHEAKWTHLEEAMKLIGSDNHD